MRITLVAFVATNAFASDITTLFTTAERAYNHGECVTAIRAFRQIYDLHESLTSREHDLLNFHSSYCYLQLGQMDAAAAGFRQFLQKYPEHQEARLRYAQILFQQGKASEAQKLARTISEDSLLTEAVLLEAQADMQLGEPELAIERLRPYSKYSTSQWAPIFYYWQGVAYYQSGDFRFAQAYFEVAEKASPESLWVKTEAKNWLKQVSRDLQTLHGNIVLGFIIDNNLAQQSILNADTTTGLATEPSPKPSTYYHDTAFYLGADFSYKLHYEPKWNLLVVGSFSSPYYIHFPTYNNQNVSGGLASTYRILPTLSASLTAKYLDSRYRGIYYQDYITATPDLTWIANPRWMFKGELPLTWYVRTRFSRTIAPAVSAKHFFEGGVVTLGGNYTKAHGEGATYSTTTPAYLLTGSMFSSYHSIGAYINASFDIGSRFSFTPQLSHYNTYYDHEPVPFATGVSDPGDREDHIEVYSAELARAMIPDVWSLAFDYTYTINRASGLQGLGSSGYVSDYNYHRTYMLFSSTLSF